MARATRQPGSTAAQAAPLLIGPHVSVAGGLANAFPNGARVGASAIQIFTRNQRTWRARPLGGEEAAAFREAWAASPIATVMAHGSYLVNLGSPDPDGLARSRAAFAEEVARCHALAIPLLNLHPGAHLGAGVRPCLARIAESLRPLLDREGPLLVLENTAGQGTTVGARLEELAWLLEALRAPARTGICLDTCHLYAAGYDLADEAGWHRFWEEFEARIGFSALRAFHLNDAREPLGSRKDRHQALGQGQLGWAVFRRLAQDARFAHLPMVLETPGGDPVWRREIRTMRRHRREREAFAAGRG